MRIVLYTLLFVGTALADAPDDIGPGGCGPGPGPTDPESPGGSTGGGSTGGGSTGGDDGSTGGGDGSDGSTGDQVDDPTLPNHLQSVQLDHSWLFDGPLAGVVEYEHDRATETLRLLGVRLDAGATALIDDRTTAAFTGWEVGTEVDVDEVLLVEGLDIPLDARGNGVADAGFLLQFELTVREPARREVEGTYHLYVPLDVPASYDGQSLGFGTIDDGIGGAFTLR
mgnify:CR=1 FL=1